ncbi:hypothetical protein CR513_49382, partial [Mucuna pruriens]
MVKPSSAAIRNNMTTKYNHSAHATWKHAPMKPASDTTSTTNPITRRGVWRKFSQVVLLLAIHKPAPIIGMDAKSVNKFKNPITNDEFALRPSFPGLFISTMRHQFHVNLGKASKEFSTSDGVFGNYNDAVAFGYGPHLDLFAKQDHEPDLGYS